MPYFLSEKCYINMGRNLNRCAVKMDGNEEMILTEEMNQLHSKGILLI
jgi:hypothetical protein